MCQWAQYFNMAPRLSRQTSTYIWYCFLCIQVSFKNWETKETLKKQQFCPESLGTMIEYWDIKRGLLNRTGKFKVFTKLPNIVLRKTIFKVLPSCLRVNRFFRLSLKNRLAVERGEPTISKMQQGQFTQAISLITNNTHWYFKQPNFFHLATAWNYFIVQWKS